MIMLKEIPCDRCYTMRTFKYSNRTDRVYNFKPICKKCTLTERNKRQNFSVRKHKIIDYFESIDSREKGYIFGFMWADAHLSENLRKNRERAIKSVILTLSQKDECVVDFIVEKIGGYKTNSDAYDKRTKKTYKRSSLFLHSKDIYDNLIGLDFRKSIKFVPKEFISHFLRGLIDGDGSLMIRENRNGFINIQISSDYYQDWSFLEGIKEIPSFSVIRGVDKKSKYSKFRINGKREEKINFLKWIYGDSNFHLERKFNKVKSIL